MYPFGYAKHARAFRTQIGLNKKNNADQFGYEKHGRAKRTQMGTLDTDSKQYGCFLD